MNRRFPSLKKSADLYRHLIMALVLNVPVIYMILMLDMRRVDFTILTWFYFSCVVIGYYVLPLLFVTTLIFILFIPLRKLAVIPIGAIITVFVYYLLIDSFAYNITKIHIEFFWLEWIVNDYKGFGLPSSTLRTALLALLGIIAVEVSILTVAWRIRKPRHLILTFSLFTVLAFGLSQVAHAVAYQRNVPIGENEAGSTANEGQRSLKYPLCNMNYNVPPATKLPNIVIVFLESWRFDMMNEKVTPNIFALSQNSSVFLKHFSSGNSTVAGTVGLFYGLHPTYWTAVKANNILIDNPVLIDVLKENQYAFGIYAKSNFERHKIRDAIFRGIEVHESFAGQTIVEQDRDMTRQVISFIREQHCNRNPYLAFAFYKSNHFPYRYPKGDSIFLPAEDINLMFAKDNTDPVYVRNDYMNSTHYVDRLIGDIIQQLDSLGDMANTVIIITTDHSDELNDNRANYWGHGSNYTKYQTMVPLVLYLPSREPQQIDYRTSHIDIAPTLLQEFFGCTTDIRDYSNGRNLFDKPSDLRPIVVGGYVNHAFIIGDNVFEIYPMYTKKYKLYDITQKASRPSPDVLKMIMKEITRFFDENDTNKPNVPVQHNVDKSTCSDTTKPLTLRSSSACNDNLDLEVKRHGR
jgi:membrane-anchored protein YejM (alkaline phosphatase superfamily)